jgi:hypothetical protein
MVTGFIEEGMMRVMLDGILLKDLQRKSNLIKIINIYTKECESHLHEFFEKTSTKDVLFQVSSWNGVNGGDLVASLMPMAQTYYKLLRGYCAPRLRQVLTVWDGPVPHFKQHRSVEDIEEIKSLTADWLSLMYVGWSRFRSETMPRSRVDLWPKTHILAGVPLKDMWFFLAIDGHGRAIVTDTPTGVPVYMLVKDLIPFAVQDLIPDADPKKETVIKDYEGRIFEEGSLLRTRDGQYIVLEEMFDDYVWGARVLDGPDGGGASLDKEYRYWAYLELNSSILEGCELIREGY